MRTIVYLVLAVVLMFADHNIPYFHRLCDQAANAMIPLEYGIDAPVRLINSSFDHLATRRKLARENASLRSELLFMRADRQRMLAVQNENEQLKALLQSSSKAGGRVLQAQILAISPSPYLHQLIIDRGQKQGVFIGQPVLDAYGVMGQVIQVGLVSSRVLLLTDSMSAVPVQDSRSGVRAIAEGHGGLNKLLLRNVTQTMDIKPGDLLITSGLDQRYPYGYPVGTISSVKANRAGQFLDIVVTPAAQFDRSRLVLLLWPNKAAIDPELVSSMQQDAKDRLQANSIMGATE